MADVFSKEKRSKIMSLIRGKWTFPERKIHGFLKGKKIRHKMHPRLPGNPDLFLPEINLAVFVHGCFWHGCTKHYREPKTRKSYWIPKIKRNKARDKEVTRKLKEEGYGVIRIWEHEVGNNSYKRMFLKLLESK